MKYFKEITTQEFPELDKSKYPDYYVEGCETRIDRLFKYKDCYIEVYVDEDGIANLAIINLGQAFNILVAQEVVSLMVAQYGIAAFTWVKDIPNVVLIKRLLKPYTIINKEETDTLICVHFKVR